MQLPITIGLHRSRFIDIVVGVLAVLASLAILAFPRSFIVQIAILLVIWGVAAWAWWHSAPVFLALRLESNGGVSVAGERDGEFSPLDLLPGITVHPWLCVLHVRTDAGRVCSLILAADSLMADDFRRLRVFLRWRADFSERGDGA